MRTVGLFEAKQKLSEPVERAREGEKIGITRRGELTAVLVPATSEISLKDIFDDLEKIRKRAKVDRGVNVKDLIEEGPVLTGFVLDASIALRWFLDHPVPGYAYKVKQFFLKGFALSFRRCSISR